MIAASLAAGIVASVVLATDFDLRIPLKRIETGVSTSGTNAICLPYDIPTSRDVASELETEINSHVYGGDDAVVKIIKFDRANDSFLEDDHTYESGESEDDFALVAGEGYRVVVNNEIDDSADGSGNNDFQFPLTGDYGATAVTLLRSANGVSATGTNHFCAPFDGQTRTAADFRDELNDAAGGCPGGTCTDDQCSGGTRAGLDCTPFSSISRFKPVDDTLQTYAGISSSNDFELKSGEAYVVKVTEDATWTPDTFSTGDVTVEIVQRVPGGAIDGGSAEMTYDGTDFDVRVGWDHAEFNHLVFLPAGRGSAGASPDLASCPVLNPPRLAGLSCCEPVGGGSWKGHVCVPPGGFDPGGECHDADKVIYNYVCGCEIRPPLDEDGPLNCNLVGCGFGNTTDCDNTEEQAEDPDVIFCNTLQSGYTFKVTEVSFDGGSTWLDNATEVGVDPPITVDIVDCCEARCADDDTIVCTVDSECGDDGPCELVIPAACQSSS